MIVFKYIFWLLYRIWFYVLVTIPIIVLFPFLLISILKESWYPYFFKLARVWARFILIGMGFKTSIEREQTTNIGESYMFTANHTSMIDIMLMLVVVKNPFVFVGKAELAKIPLLGFFYKRTSILVDRSSPKSRQAVFFKGTEAFETRIEYMHFSRRNGSGGTCRVGRIQGRSLSSGNKSSNSNSAFDLRRQ